MKPTICLLLTSAALALTTRPALAVPVPCSGGTIDIGVTSDTPLTGAAFNVGQEARFSAIASGISPSSYSWTIPGPHIKNYQEDLGTRTSPMPAAPTPWSTTALSPADLAMANVSLFFKPSAAQVHPLNGPPESRTVSLTVNVGAASCTVTRNVTVERNLADPDRQPEDYYTSNHRAPATTNPKLGNVVDEHMYWHGFVGGGPVGHWSQFLPWHGYFLGRFDQWRAEFGYPPVAPWQPGRPLPTGPEFDHPAALRLVYSPDANRVPPNFTLAGSIPTLTNNLAQYASLDAFNSAFEPFFHGQIHCNIGVYDPDFFTTDGPLFGSMCLSSSPKDPMFWRWHGFIDRLYRNYCRLKSLTCHFSAMPAADIWMADNLTDVANGGTVPSPGIHWMSPDVWNRTAEVTTDACMPRTTPPFLNTVGGVTRNCGSDADHENPVSGATNYLYATLRNTSGTPQRNVYAEVAVYIANASTGLSWPADFTMLPESRQFITLNLEPGQATQIGPLPWTPPSPTPSDHFCIYLKVLSVQETPPVEGANVDTNVANSNSIAWRNMKVVNPGQMMMAQFIVRNIQPREELLTLDVTMPPELLGRARPVLTLDAALQRAAGERLQVRGARMLDRGRILITEPRVSLAGLRMPARAKGVVAVRIEGGPQTPPGDVIITQRSSRGVDGGVTIRVAPTRGGY